MIDLFAIFGKGGIVLWCFQGTSQLLQGAVDAFSPSVNALIRNVFIQEHNTSMFQHDQKTLKFKLDNELDLVFLVIYSSVVQLAYTDRLLDDVKREFRDRYKNILEDWRGLLSSLGSQPFSAFDPIFSRILKTVENAAKEPTKVEMRQWTQSAKSQKTVASIIQSGPNKPVANTKIPVKQQETKKEEKMVREEEEKKEEKVEEMMVNGNGGLNEIEAKRLEFFKKQQGSKGTKKTGKPNKGEEAGGKAGKKPRKWDDAVKGKEAEALDRSRKKPNQQTTKQMENNANYQDLKGSMKGDVPDLEDNPDLDSDSDEEEDPPVDNKASSGRGFGFLSAFKSLVGQKELTMEDIQPVLDKMKEHLIAKNVAAEIAEKLCESLGQKLEGRVVSSWRGVSGLVRETLRDSLVQLLSPRRRLNILRDVEEAKHHQRPFTIAFCGVNGVGKSTNLAKICFWLNENGYQVMIAACDTFRAGAVEQLRTHYRHLNALHPGMVQLYEQGYGKDAAAVAAQAITQATASGVHVVLIDTAGRMQDNEPLMRALTKLIKVNEPDLVVFVGEALVGNEAVDQLVKFNQALADHAPPGAPPRFIDAIVLTKFDTIDDKVGAAISMTYTTGQPIAFVGTGQTYKDLKNLNANAVVNALLKK